MSDTVGDFHPRPEWDSRYKAKTDKTVIAWVVGIVLVGVLVIGGVLVAHAVKGQSQSYKDGYAYAHRSGACGGEGCFEGTPLDIDSASDYCNDAWGDVSDQTLDNQRQWMSGCEAYVGAELPLWQKEANDGYDTGNG